MSVAEAVARDLEEIARADPVLARSSLAEAALALAAEVDTVANSATSKAACARELRETMNQLREMAPVEEDVSEVDRIAARARKKIKR